jgi:hypothetical protein
MQGKSLFLSLLPTGLIPFTGFFQFSAVSAVKFYIYFPMH